MTVKMKRWYVYDVAFGEQLVEAPTRDAARSALLKRFADAVFTAVIEPATGAITIESHGELVHADGSVETAPRAAIKCPHRHIRKLIWEGRDKFMCDDLSCGEDLTGKVLPDDHRIY